MKKLFFLIAASVILISCSKLSEQDIIEADSIQIAEAKINDDGKGMLPIDLDIYDIAIPGGEYTLEDVDRYYKEEIPLHQGKHYYDNLKSFTINGLYLHGISESDNPEMINYYIEEQMEMAGNLSNIELFYKLLKTKEGRWTKEKLNHYSSQFIEKNRKHYNSFSEKTKIDINQKLDKLDNWAKEV